MDLEFRDLLNALSSKIYNDVPDPKGYQGNLNTFSSTDRLKIALALKGAYLKAKEAADLELTGKDQKASIQKWAEVFGSAFPKYTE